MKREDLAAMGLTDEQIEKVIAENGKDVQTANAKATKNNAELERLQGIEKEFNAMKDQNLSEQEKAAKQLEEANNRIAELEKAQTLATQRTSAADKFKITSEQAAQVVKDDGSFDFDVLGKLSLIKRLLRHKPRSRRLQTDLLILEVELLAVEKMAKNRSRKSG